MFALQNFESEEGEARSAELSVSISAALGEALLYLSTRNVRLTERRVFLMRELCREAISRRLSPQYLSTCMPSDCGTRRSIVEAEMRGAVLHAVYGLMLKTSDPKTLASGPL